MGVSPRVECDVSSPLGVYIHVTDHWRVVTRVCALEQGGEGGRADCSPDCALREDGSPVLAPQRLCVHGWEWSVCPEKGPQGTPWLRGERSSPPAPQESLQRPQTPPLAFLPKISEAERAGPGQGAGTAHLG